MDGAVETHLELGGIYTLMSLMVFFGLKKVYFFYNNMNSNTQKESIMPLGNIFISSR